ncbi:MAG TPA: prolyl oligopeptidase family serine peptidase, partial [Woeseiaceae bacterium]
RNSDWGTAAYYVYDNETSRTEKAELGDLTPRYSSAESRPPAGLEAAWFGNRLAVIASPESVGENGVEAQSASTARPDWYLLGDERQVNLTQLFEPGLPELVSASEHGGVFLHSGKAWLVDGTGKPRDIAPSLDTQLAPWPDDPYLPRQAQTSGTVILQTRNEDAGSRLLFVDLETGDVDTVRASSAHARFAAASPRRRLAAIVEPVGNASLLSIASAGTEQQPVAKINTHLDAVRGGTPQRIDHDGPDGSPRHSWILLPPGYRKDSRLPTIVNVYPGRVGGTSFRLHTLDRVSALNDHLIAARGYAVLYPSLSSEPGPGLRDPIENLERDVFVAVDAAVAAGYVDADRLAVQGQSYGGYAAAALIGRTNRFKAAVASAGIYNLISFYGVFDPRAWQHVERRGLRMFGVSWLETGLGHIGEPPWRAPERYLRNSPLMHIESVTTPVMLIHGDRDFVSITQAEEYFTALKRLNKKAMFVRYIGEGHVPYSPANMRDLWQRLYGWFEEHLGAPYPVLREP